MNNRLAEDCLAPCPCKRSHATCLNCDLRELGEWLGGTEYKTVSKAAERFAKKAGER